MKFLIDENVHRRLFSFLVSLKQDAILSPQGWRNGQVFGLAFKEKRILLTRDEDFLGLNFVMSEHYGIVLLRVSSPDLEAQKRALSLLLEKFSNSEEIKNKCIRLSSDKGIELL